MRFTLPASAFLILALAGCATPQQKQARLMQKMERQTKEEDTRAIEQRRMLAMENGAVNSSRGASILYPDKHQTFDANAHSAASERGFNTKNASTKDYYTDRQLRVDTYGTRDFYDAKPDSGAQRKYATSEASTKGKHIIPNVGKAADTKTAATKDSPYANKSAPSHSVADGRRPYLGQESKKLGETIDAKDLANWRNSGEAIVYSDGTVERVSSLKSLSIDDIRQLLNKSK